MAEPSDLETLGREYPPPERGIGSRVLREYSRITAARQHGWRWTDIASALGLARARGKPLALAYRRVQARIAAGALVPPPTGTRRPGGPAAGSSAFSEKPRHTFKFDDDN